MRSPLAFRQMFYPVPSRASVVIGFCVVVVLFSPSAEAKKNKLEVATGFYSLSGKTATRSGSASGIGTYRIGYRRNISAHFDLAVGYNLTYSSIFTGDSASGLDMGAIYFPFSSAGQMEFERNGQYLSLEQSMRPFISMAFHQRNVQSVQTTYTGFGFGIGIEKAWSENTSVSAGLRISTLSGSVSATASLMDVLIGIVWGF